MIADSSASSSANDVSMSTFTSGKRSRISRHASTPDPSGSRTSITTTSGSSKPTRRTASAADDASPTTVRSSWESTRALRPCRTTS